MLHVGTDPAPNTHTTTRGDDQIAKSCSPHASCWQTPRLYNQRRRRPDSRQVLFSTCFMLAPGNKHPDYTTRGGDDQTADKSCSPHASCWHPATNTQTTTRGQQTNLVLHMLHVGTQHQTPRPRQSRCGRHGFSNILKLQATFLYSIYHQRAAGADLARCQRGVWVWGCGVGGE